MPMFIPSYSYSEDHETRGRVRPEHRYYLSVLVDQDRLLLAGELRSRRPCRRTLVSTASDVEEVRKLVAADPFSISGVIVSTDINSWTPVLGASVAALSAPSAT